MSSTERAPACTHARTSSSVTAMHMQTNMLIPTPSVRTSL
jgi:hypothetical protein